MSDFPRRIQMQQWCEAERKIYEAMQSVEQMAADVRLTDAVCLLGAARDRVADFVDGVEGKRTMSSSAALGGAGHEPSDDEITRGAEIIVRRLDIAPTTAAVLAREVLEVARGDHTLSPEEK